MGVSSNSLHVRTDDHQAVVRAYTSWLRRRGYRPRAEGAIPHYLETHDEPVFRRVLVSQPQDGWVTVVDQAHDEQDLGPICRACTHLSRVVGCACIAFVVHDSQALYYYLCDRGVLLDRYCSWPGWYSESPVTTRVRQRWKASPERLLPSCRDGVTVARLQAILRDYSRDLQPGVMAPWPENVLLDLAGCLGIGDPARTYALYHASPPGVFLDLPGRDGGAPARVRINTGPRPGPSWEGFVHLNFLKLS